MSQIITPTQTNLTLAEYLFYQGKPDSYELFRGQLIPIPTPTALHTRICHFLVYQFQRYSASINLALVATSSTGVRTEENSSRIPDVVVCTQNLWEQVCNRAGASVLDFNEAPVLVVEVVSDNWREDYIRKRAEYALIDISEYWIVDPKKDRVWVLSHPESEEGYKKAEFKRGQQIVSLQFSELTITADQVLFPPIVEDLIREEQAQRQQLERKAERLAAKLREMGIDPDTLE